MDFYKKLKWIFSRYDVGNNLKHKAQATKMSLSTTSKSQQLAYEILEKIDDIKQNFYVYFLIKLKLSFLKRVDTHL